MWQPSKPNTQHKTMISVSGMEAKKNVVYGIWEVTFEKKFLLWLYSHSLNKEANLAKEILRVLNLHTVWKPTTWRSLRSFFFFLTCPTQQEEWLTWLFSFMHTETMVVYLLYFLQGERGAQGLQGFKVTSWYKRVHQYPLPEKKPGLNMLFMFIESHLL